MSRLSGESERLTWRAMCLAMCASVTFAGLGQAHASTPDIMVLRNDLTDSSLSAVIDGELASALIERAHFESSYFSPTPYGDIELAAGCHASTDECVQRVASSLEADRLLVRELRRDASGALVLTLVAKESNATRRAESVITARGGKRPEIVVPQLIARVYEHSDAPATPVPTEAPKKEPHRLRMVGYGAVGASVALFASGIGMGVSSRRAHDDYTATTVTDARSAERADARLAEARHRAHVANVLFVSGAAAATTGLVMLLWGRFRREERPPRVALGLEPTTKGGYVRVTGRLGRL
jgi:hypothetical protein